MKNQKLQIRIAEEEKRDLAKLSEYLGVPSSQIVREAIKEKIACLPKISAATTPAGAAIVK